MEETEDWGVQIETSPKEDKIVESTLGKQVEILVDKLILATDQVYEGTFDYKRAERIAALALKVRIIIADFLKESELQARQYKNNLKLVRAEAKFKYLKSEKAESGKKPSDASLDMLVDKDLEVKEAEDRLAELELETKKWTNILNIGADAHVFFRNLNRV